ncbi:extracellular solute-binding protein, family 3 [Alkaliphilus metalliredigens QYMF]|uniref:Extracellular solute-binding protein, family 3 n=1 Tax=Alkaliphilus metalliredigens (strain QYMF) TaxID=293826 RepID=A6TMN1_ALKMQ|nr:amino acid ABC transporter substrate-binding protein [Alkaliphilus metalliredigens]ABR47449.1 extracellular solute-binding protein, family 3 [Alkaliphilus metalliredigens QYMF]
MKKRIVLFALLSLIVGVLAACQSTEVESTDNDPSPEVSLDTIKVGTSGGYHPYTFMNDDDTLDGFEIDTWNEIGERANLEIQFETSAFSGLFGMLDSNRINTIANQITMTAEREEKYLFTEPYVFSGAQILVKGDNDSITSLEDLKGKRVGVSLGSNYEQLLREFDTENEIDIVTYEDFSGSVQEVALGRLDAMINDRLASMINIESSGLDLKLGGDPVHPLQNAFPFVDNEENAVLVERINNAIVSMHEDGTFSEISNKWFEIDITSK